MTNVLFILVDALRATSLGCYGYPRATSPAIDALAQRGVLFEQAFCTVNATDPSLTTILSGLFPRTHGILHHGDQISAQELALFEQRRIMLLPELLQKRGYRTYGLDWLGRWHRRGYDYYAGFNVDRTGRKKLLKRIRELAKRVGAYRVLKKIYYLPMLRSVIGKFDLYNEDAALTRQAADIIRREERPFFLFIHYWGLHAPYNCPQASVREFSRVASPVRAPSMEKSFAQIKNEKYRAFYQQWTRDEKSFDDIIIRHDGAIRQIDGQIGLLLDALRSSGKLGDTVIVLTSDHGESLVEHGILFDHHGLYDASVRVPLLIAAPGVHGKRVPALVQHPDIVPTALALLGIEAPPALDGKNLLPLVAGRVAAVRDAVVVEENYYEHKECVRTLQHKLIRSLNGDCTRCGIMHGSAIELYDLQQDPGEERNIADRMPKVVERLLARLERHRPASSAAHARETELLRQAIGELAL